MESLRQIENQEQYLLNCNKSLKILTEYHCPIYAPNKRRHPVTIGSGVLIDVYGHKFLVTAGHVLDYTYTHRVSLKSKNKLIDISGDIIETKFSSKRSEDKIDLALLELNEEMKAALSEYKYLPIEDIDYNHISNEDNIPYTFVGFPATKNILRYNSKSIKGGVFSYTATKVENHVYSKLSVSPITHIIIKFRKRKLVSKDNKSITAPDPYAMSGGGIWLNNNFHHHPSIYKPKTKLVGIALSWHKQYQCLMGVSTGAIIEILKVNCNIPELFSHKTNMIPV